MRSFTCVCGNRLFFENIRCTRCQREVGWHPAAGAVVAIEPIGGGRYRPATPDRSAAELVKCHNYAVEGVCNRLVNLPLDDVPPLCACCRFNVATPDLSTPGHRAQWARLESAKRRLFYELDLLHLPRGRTGGHVRLPLSFDFSANEADATNGWRPREHQRVLTGHAQGRITINLLEADDAARERIRLEMGESYRTLIGHFRHEIGHYYWELMVRDRAEMAFVPLFGDHRDPPYPQAVKRHYHHGPPADWMHRYPTAYASAHPWEDWAETFAAYLEMVSTLDTAAAWGLTGRPAVHDLDAMLNAHHRLGIALNEINRTMGVPDVLVRNLVPPVIEKMRFIHALCRDAAAAQGPKHSQRGRRGTSMRTGVPRRSSTNPAD